MPTRTLTRAGFESKRSALVQRHRSGAGGIASAAALTALHDALLASSYATLTPAERSLFAVVALGGYGRRELCFGSDVDVMLLVRDATDPGMYRAPVQHYLHLLLDHGLNIGHSVRTAGDCLATAETDIESWMSLLEARRVCGPSTVVAELHRGMKSLIARSDRGAFVRKMEDLVERRHGKYGTSAKLLEPNIKNSAGGLRDLHTAFWTLRGTGALPPVAGGNGTATAAMLRSSVLRRLVRPERLREVLRAFDTLLRVRNEMHLHSNSLNDTLAFTLQPTIAAALEKRQKDPHLAVDRFMQKYYVAARHIAWLASRVHEQSADQWLRPAGWSERKTLDEAFELRHARIHPLRSVRRLTNAYVLRAFLHRAEQRAEFSFGLEDAIHRNEHVLRPLSGPAERALWQKLMHLPDGIGRTLQRMNVLGLLARFIPEWAPLVAFFQHNQYHFYTADEHTLLVVANAEGLQNAAGPFADVFRTLRRPDILYWACLLHDIAKPVRLSTHEIAGVPIAQAVLRRCGAADSSEEVSFLVRHHLLMEQVAFRRNLADPQTILEFAQRFASPELLDELFVLTYADLSAVNRNVLTEWKSSLLHELYRKAREVIVSRATHDEVVSRTQEERESAERLVVKTLRAALPEKLVRNHLALMEDPSYVTSFSPEEIREHLEMVIHRPLVRSQFRTAGDVTEVTVVARDAPFALARFCGVLSANDANILDAGIYTRRDGIIIDRFRVADFVTRSCLGADQCERIQQELDDVFHSRTEIQDLLARHRAKWKRRSVPVNPNIRLDAAFEEHPHYTIIDVFAADTLGFLYRITETLSRLGLNIAFAKISSRTDGIVDSFYVTDEHGRRITEEAHKEAIRQEVMQTVRETAERELVVG